MQLPDQNVSNQSFSLFSQSPFEKAVNYFTSLARKVEIDFSSKMLWVPSNIDAKIGASEFYSTLETETDLNCFEKNSRFYFSLLQLYPEAQPTLLTMLQDRRNLHAGVTFVHNDQIHYGDPISQVLGPATIGTDKIQVRTNILSNSFEEHTIEFDEIAEVEPTTLVDMIQQLQKPSGIINYFLGSGQIASRMCDWPYTPSLFIHIDDEQNIHGQIRYQEIYQQNDNALLYLHHNPFTNQTTAKSFRYASSFWQTTNGKHLIDSKDTTLSEHVERAVKVAEYLDQTGVNFRPQKNHRNHIEKNEKPRKDIKAAIDVGNPFRDYYLDFLEHDEGPEYGEEPDLSEYLQEMLDQIKYIKHPSDETPIEESPEVEKTSNKAKNKMFDEIKQRYGFQYFRLAWDFKRYVAEIKKH